MSEQFDPFEEKDREAENDYADEVEQEEGGGCLEELPAEGRYEDCVITSAGFKHSKAGNPMWRITVTCTSTPEASSDLYIVCTTKAAFVSKPKVEALGLKWPKRGQPWMWVKGDFVGKKVAATGAHEEYQGEVQFKFQELHAHADGAGSKVELDDDVPF